jgi:hypothetical protein
VAAKKGNAKDATSASTGSAEHEINGIPLIAVSGSEALAGHERLLAQFKTTKRFPVILGDRAECERLVSAVGPDHDAAKILAEAEKIKPEKWFRERAESHPGSLEPEDLADSEVETDVDPFKVPSWSARKKIFIGLFEVEASWQVFAHLNYGNWNECPTAAEHCAIHQYWNAEYGTELLSLAFEDMHLRAPQRPKGKPAAIKLARQQYVYCNDSVEQGTQSIGALAGTLLKSDHWYFWWD